MKKPQGIPVVYTALKTWPADNPKQNLCPICGLPFHRGYVNIPIPGNSRGYDVFGKCCRMCQCMYIPHSVRNAIISVLRDNIEAKSFTVDGSSYWNYTEAANVDPEKRIIEIDQEINALLIEKRQMEDRLVHLRNIRKYEKNKEELSSCRSEMEKVPYSELIILVHQKNNSPQKYIICSKRPSEEYSHGEYHAIFYADELARELLAAAFVKEKSNTGTYHGQRYTVLKVLPKNDSDTILSDQLLPKRLLIRTGGGYYSHIQAARKELVDMLLYSPYTARYELLKATYDKEEDYCYTDIALYRQFTHEYGNPNLPIKFSPKASREWDSFNEESILKMFGYSVSQKDDLTASQRHSILAEIVDLGILEVSDIVQYLNGFLNTRSGEMYRQARQKWETDRSFIQSYHVDPQRFLIAKDIQDTSLER